MRTSIGLRAYGQKNPLNEYKREAFFMFENMLGRVRERVTTLLSHAQFQLQKPQQTPTPEEHQSTLEPDEDNTEPEQNQPMVSDKTPRNAPCPCGSGKKFKHCCGKI